MRCYRCNKHQFIGSAPASMVAQEIADRDMKPMRVYPCPYGFGWHLTSTRRSGKSSIKLFPRQATGPLHWKR